jgi:hypothetical protein
MLTVKGQLVAPFSVAQVTDSQLYVFIKIVLNT